MNPTLLRYGEKLLAMILSLMISAMAIAVVLVLLHWSLAE